MYFGTARLVLRRPESAGVAEGAQAGSSRNRYRGRSSKRSSDRNPNPAAAPSTPYLTTGQASAHQTSRPTPPDDQLEYADPILPRLGPRGCRESAGVVDRAISWPGALDWAEAHTASDRVLSATWASPRARRHGRGSRPHLLANPNTTAATDARSCARTGHGVKQFTVNPRSRFNVRRAPRARVQNEAFGPLIQ